MSGDMKNRSKRRRLSRFILGVVKLKKWSVNSIFVEVSLPVKKILD